MSIFSFLHTPKNKVFNFQPRYYDPIKEDIEQRVQLIKNEKNLEINGGTRKMLFSFGKRQKENRSTSITQLVLLAFFATITISFWYWGSTGVIIVSVNE